MSMFELTMHEAFALSCAIRARVASPEHATSESIRAEWDAIDAALAPYGLPPYRSDSMGNPPAGRRNTWFVAQCADGLITGRWGIEQAEVAVSISLRGDQPLRWIVADPGNEIHRRYYPKTSMRASIFPLTDGPMEAPPVESDLFDLLGKEWTA